MAKQARSCIVIGAGLAGLSAAYRLRKSGWTVTVLEALQRVGGRVSCLTLSKTRAHFSIRSPLKTSAMKSSSICDLGYRAFRGSDRFTATGCVPKARASSLAQRDYR